MYNKVNKIGDFIKTIIIVGSLAFFSISLIKEYLVYKDLVMEVESTVVDSLNYLEQSKKNEEDIYYSSLMICQWEINGEVYKRKIQNNGTYLMGDIIPIKVLKKDPGTVKHLSLSDVVGVSIFFIFVIIIFVLMFKGDKLYKKFILKEKNIVKDEGVLFVDIEEENINERKKRRRILVFKIIVASACFIVTTILLISNCSDYYLDNTRENINVNCTVLTVDNYIFNGRECTDIIGQWEIDGQIYKKEITKLAETYIEGEKINLLVQEDTEKTLMITRKVNKSDLILFLSFELGIGAFIIFTIIKYKK